MKKPVSLQEWQDMFASIYQEKNELFYKPADLLLLIVEATAKIDKSFRTEDFSGIDEAMARLFGWLMAFCTSIKVSLEKAVFDKYSGLCPYCGNPLDCICISESLKPTEWEKGRGISMPGSLPGWQFMFSEIYGSVNRVAGREKIWLHAHEELGELSKAFRLEESREIREEIADLFAWFIAFCNHLKINLADLVYSRYPGKCDECKKAKCLCPRV